MSGPSESGEAMVRGRILRLKLGFNPNSSSIGTIVFAMPAALIGLTVAFGAAAALACSALLHGREHEPPAKPAEEAAKAAPSEDDGARPRRVRKRRKKRKPKRRSAPAGATSESSVGS